MALPETVESVHSAVQSWLRTRSLLHRHLPQQALLLEPPNYRRRRHLPGGPQMPDHRLLELRRHRLSAAARGHPPSAWPLADRSASQVLGTRRLPHPTLHTVLRLYEVVRRTAEVVHRVMSHPSIAHTSRTEEPGTGRVEHATRYLLQAGRISCCRTRRRFLLFHRFRKTGRATDRPQPVLRAILRFPRQPRTSISLTHLLQLRGVFQRRGRQPSRPLRSTGLRGRELRERLPTALVAATTMPLVRVQLFIRRAYHHPQK